MLISGSFVALTAIFIGTTNASYWKLGVDPGPKVIATRGEVWPKPQQRITDKRFFIIRPNHFSFKVSDKTCDILEQAIRRYRHYLRVQERTRRMIRTSFSQESRRQTLLNEPGFKGYLDQLSVDLSSPCETFPAEDMDEHYELRIDTEDFPNEAHLISQSIWGILRGLETWSHIVHISTDNTALLVNSTSIMDFPKYTHRGLLIDTSRHFLPLRIITQMMDAMVMSKMNVLHWHIVDDQSFPYQSKSFPDLSAKGAYSPTHVYSQADVQAVIEYARIRGIRVIPEFDTPGHTRSWGQAYPELLVPCYNGDVPDGSLGPMNPIAPETYEFMKNILKEIKETFPESYIHLGGDEVDFKCWKSNPEIKDFMTKTNFSAKELEGMFVRKTIDLATNLSAKTIVWQEVYDDNVDLPKDTVVHVWKRTYYSEMNAVTFSGYQVLFSSCWYLDSLDSGGDWKKFYDCDPHYIVDTELQRALILGGEACMWGEVVDVNNVLSRVWPRACAAAEKLWSSYTVRDKEDAEKRLEEHTCRMNLRNIPAQPPNGPGFCPGINFL